MLDQAKLAVVAYGEVVGSDGSSTQTNSGVFTTRVADGQYWIDLSRTPSGLPNVQGLLQYSDRDLIMVTPHNSATPGFVGFPTAENDLGTDGAIKKVLISNFSTGLNTDFAFIIWRTLTPPVAGGPA